MPQALFPNLSSWILEWSGTSEGLDKMNPSLSQKSLFFFLWPFKAMLVLETASFCRCQGTWGSFCNEQVGKFTQEDTEEKLLCRARAACCQSGLRELSERTEEAEVWFPAGQVQWAPGSAGSRTPLRVPGAQHPPSALPSPLCHLLLLNDTGFG